MSAHATVVGCGPRREDQGRNPAMNGDGKSDSLVVPGKSPNDADLSAEEEMEGRRLAKGNMDPQNTPRTQSRNECVPSALDRVRDLARKDKRVRFTALLHHVTVDRLRDAFLALRRNAAPGNGVFHRG